MSNHTQKGRKLSRKTGARRSLLANLASEVLKHEQIQTTFAKAKETSRLVDKLIRYGRKGTLHDRRLAAKILYSKSLITKLFDDVAKRNVDRVSGHTKVFRIGQRKGDQAEMALIRLCDTKIFDDVVEPDAVEEAVEVKAPKAKKKPAKKAESSAKTEAKS